MSSASTLASTLASTTVSSMSRYGITSLKYIEPQVLRSWLESGRSEHGKFAIVDVRDDDFMGGHIINCHHYPSKKFDGKVFDLIEEVDGCQDIVFHCALSQQRGPSAALKFLRSLQEDDHFNVYVLRGGFYEWQKIYGRDKDVTLEYDRNFWRYY